MYEPGAAGHSGGGVDLADPHWFPDDLNLATGRARFVRVSREELSRQPFLDPRWSRAGLPQREAPGTALTAPEGDHRPRLNFIWHTSYCCSTVLAAALDRPGVNLSLKEPQALVGLANLKRGQGGALKRPPLARALFGLYARRFSSAEQVLIKPSNFANNLIAEAGEMTDGRMLMLYSSCRSFLISIIKAHEDRRAFPRELFVSLSMDGHPQAKWPTATLVRLTDLQIAATAWQMQIAEMRRGMARLGDRAASLDGDRFASDPRAVVEALDGFFGLGLGASDEAAWLERDVKTGGERDENARREDAERIEREWGGALDRIIEWSARASGAAAEEPPLGRPLLP
ncbi:MAG TPA: hypothetical protein VF559_00815 [Caulobacteraceae bacterium]|jgi:hypothetical protein